MSLKHLVLIVLLCVVFNGTVIAEGLDLKIKNFKIDPKPAATTEPRIKLSTHRSYLVIVTIEKTNSLPKGESFVVRTECIQKNKTMILGEARVGDSGSWNIYACYDLFPGEMGPGDCMLRTTIDAENEITESDESELSNNWDRKATLF